MGNLVQTNITLMNRQDAKDAFPSERYANVKRLVGAAFRREEKKRKRKFDE